MITRRTRRATLAAVVLLLAAPTVGRTSGRAQPPGGCSGTVGVVVRKVVVDSNTMVWLEVTNRTNDLVGYMSGNEGHFEYLENKRWQGHNDMVCDAGASQRWLNIGESVTIYKAMPPDLAGRRIRFVFRGGGMTDCKGRFDYVVTRSFVAPRNTLHPAAAPN